MHPRVYFHTSVALFFPQEPNSSRLCTCNAPPKHRISFALQALNYLPPKAFCVPIFKEAKGKTQAIRLPFCTHSELLQTTQKLMSRRAMTHIKCRFNCLQRVWWSCHERVRSRVICEKRCASHSRGRNRKGAHLHMLKSRKAVCALSFAQLFPYCGTNAMTGKGRRGSAGPQLCTNSHLINSIKEWADGDLSPLYPGMNNEFNGSHLDASNLSSQRNQSPSETCGARTRAEIWANFNSSAWLSASWWCLWFSLKTLALWMVKSFRRTF